MRITFTDIRSFYETECSKNLGEHLPEASANQIYAVIRSVASEASDTEENSGGAAARYPKWSERSERHFG